MECNRSPKAELPFISPLDAAKFIASNATNVAIKPENIGQISRLILEGLVKENFELANWKSLEVNPKVADNFAVDWIFFIDLLNFSFWAEGKNQYVVTYNGTAYTGYFAMCAAVQKAISNHIPITDPKFYASITKKQLGDILRSDIGEDVPLLDERHNHLLQSGNTLLKNFEGTFVNCLKKCNNNAQSLVKFLVETFPSFRDEAIYNGKRVSFYKRAQILVADIWACFEGDGLGYFNDIDSLTMFADYRVPQVLAYYGVLKYSDALKEKLRQKFIFSNGSPEEVEIRGCSIWVVELIKKEMESIMAENPSLTPKLKVNSVMIDFFLWEYRRQNAKDIDEIPFHRVRCIYY